MVGHEMDTVFKMHVKCDGSVLKKKFRATSTKNHDEISLKEGVMKGNILFFIFVFFF